MFSIILSEKNGTERREAFDKFEIVIGRVQAGNDLVLARGNVSKQHARLSYRDAQYWVQDLKSTNGTFVNGRKILQETIIGDGDKVFIGDFVIRIDRHGKFDDKAKLYGLAPGSPIRPELSPGEVARTTARVVSEGSDGARQVAGVKVSHSDVPPARRPPLDNSAAPANRGGGTMMQFANNPIVFSSPSNRHGVEGSAASSTSQSWESNFRLPNHGGEKYGQLGASLNDGEVQKSKLAISSSVGDSRFGGHTVLGGSDGSNKSNSATTGSISDLAIVGMVVSSAIHFFVSERHKNMDKTQIESSIKHAINQLQSSGQLPSSIDFDELTGRAYVEFCSLGPLVLFLGDKLVECISVIGAKRIYIKRVNLDEYELSDEQFLSEELLERAIVHLSSGNFASQFFSTVGVDGRMDGHVAVTSIVPPLSSSCILHIIKKRPLISSINELVSGEWMPVKGADFLDLAVRSKANILYVGPSSLQNTVALTFLSHHSGRAVCAYLAHAPLRGMVSKNIVVMSASGEAIRSAFKLGVEYTHIDMLSGELAVDFFSQLGVNCGGISLGLGERTAVEELSKFAFRLCVASPSGLPLDLAKVAIANHFDLIVELRYVNSRPLVWRISEIFLSEGGQVNLQLRDLYLVPKNGSGAIAPTGVVPKLAQRWGQLGIRWEPSLFVKDVV